MFVIGILLQIRKATVVRFMHTALIAVNSIIFNFLVLNIGRICYYDLEDSKFTDNQAFLEGGFMKYNFYPPTLGPNLTFENDNAPYG